MWLLWERALSRKCCTALLLKHVSALVAVAGYLPFQQSLYARESI